MFTCTLKNQTYQFRSIADVLAKASEEKSGDIMAGISAESSLERMAAKVVLSEMTLKKFTRIPSYRTKRMKSHALFMMI